ncbi:MmcQ/YjbR family DNA-binding protein [Agromyces sp. NPDC049794]|uniref:MmcQ/YjbR family DNA-binding protein n=1 Tax=unclassified Agromyces TaxID=2639701 RepID=UPI0033D3C591
MPAGRTERMPRASAQWKVNGKGFVWERPLRRTDLEFLGIEMQAGPVLGAACEDEAVKRALVAEDPAVFFTTPHFDGYAAVLVHLDAISRRRLGELVAEAWVAKAPAALVREHLRHEPD